TPFFLLIRIPPICPLFPYTTLFRSVPSPDGLRQEPEAGLHRVLACGRPGEDSRDEPQDRILADPPSHEPGTQRNRAMGEPGPARSEEHTSELQSRGQLVCRLLLEKK